MIPATEQGAIIGIAGRTDSSYVCTKENRMLRGSRQRQVKSGVGGRNRNRQNRRENVGEVRETLINSVRSWNLGLFEWHIWECQQNRLKIAWQRSAFFLCQCILCLLLSGGG